MDLNLDEIIIKEILPKKSFFFNSTEMLRIPFSMIYLIIIALIIFNTSGFFFNFWYCVYWSRNLLFFWEMDI